MTTAAKMPGLTVREVLATGRFWMLVAVFFLVGISLNGTAAHVVPLLTDAGIPRGAGSGDDGHLRPGDAVWTPSGRLSRRSFLRGLCRNRPVPRADCRVCFPRQRPRRA